MKTLSLFRFGEFEVDPLSRTLRRQGEALTLTRRAFDVLLYFVRDPARPLSKDELMKSVWPDTAVDENSLMQSISVLRKALDEKPGESRYIATLQGRGYQFVSSVQTIATDCANSEPVAVGTGEGTAREAPEPRNWRRIALAGALALAVSAAAGYLAWRHFRPAPPPMVVVLADFADSTGEADFDGVLNRALLIDLEQSPFLNLLTRSTVEETLSEMRRKRDEVLTPALAREVCQRNNGQAMLHGTLSRLGASYLLLLDAEGCVSGKRLGGYKTEVASKERILEALDTAASRVRRELGESGASRERFQTPIARATTPSLDALRAYSQAADSLERGDFESAQRLLERAIGIDPNFASAYRLLGTSYYNRSDSAHSTAYYRKAFDLRESTTERERFSIEVLYYGGGIHDLEEAIRSLTLFNQAYPGIAKNWGNLCNLYTQLGEYPQAIGAGERAVLLDPSSSYAAEVLARAYKRAGRYGDAKRVAQAAIAAGRDRAGLHSILFQIAFGERDEARLKVEGEWGLTHQHLNPALDDLGFAAATSGRLREALDDFSRARTEALRSGEAEYADGVLLDIALVLNFFKEPDRAAASIRQMRGDAGDPDFRAIVQAQTGDPAAARRIAAAANPIADKDTIRVYYSLPRLRAVLALMDHHPEEAARLLEPARPYQLRNFRVPYLRAEAETEAGLPEAAAADYRLILANQGVDPISPEYPLSHLGLARVLAMQKQPGPARQEYEALFAAWKNADADLPPLVAARREYAALPAGRM
jgi:DNA-binding winged helix-turn-helix (wHTH) protein/tetratricopeptide (TPR) repeat protein